MFLRKSENFNEDKELLIIINDVYKSNNKKNEGYKQFGKFINDKNYFYKLK